MSEAAAEVTTTETPVNAGVTDVSHETTNVDATDTPDVDGREGATTEAPVELTAEEMATLEGLLPRYKPTLKVDGEERQLSYEEVLAEAQISKASQKRFQEATAIEEKAKQAIIQAQENQAKIERFMKLMKENPAALAQEAGVSAQEYRDSVEKFLYEQLQRDQMSPEERAVYEKAASFDEQAQKLKKYEEAESAQAHAQQVERYRQEFDKKMTSALETHAVPDASKPYVVKQVAAHLHALIGQGVADPDVAKVTELVVERMNTGVNDYVKNLPVNELTSRLTPAQLKELRQAQIDAIKTPQDKLNVANKEGIPQSKPKAKKGLTRQEWEAHKKKLLSEL